MAVLHRPDRNADRAYRDDAYQRGAVEERESVHTGEGLNAALRAVGAIAGGVATVIGIVALIRINWNNGFDSAPADVVGMLFTPAVAIATTVLGLIALAAGAAYDRTSKLVVGAILACVGLGILIAGTSRSDWDLESGHGWLSLAVGAVLVVTGLLMRRSYSMRRTVRSEGYRA